MLGGGGPRGEVLGGAEGVGEGQRAKVRRGLSVLSAWSSCCWVRVVSHEGYVWAYRLMGRLHRGCSMAPGRGTTNSGLTSDWAMMGRCARAGKGKGKSQGRAEGVVLVVVVVGGRWRRGGRRRREFGPGGKLLLRNGVRG